MAVQVALAVLIAAVWVVLAPRLIHRSEHHGQISRPVAFIAVGVAWAVVPVVPLLVGMNAPLWLTLGSSILFLVSYTLVGLGVAWLVRRQRR